MFRNQGKDAIGGAAGQPHQGFAALAAKPRDKLVGIVLEPGDHLSAVAPRRAVADIAGLEQDHRAACFGERERAGKSRIAGTDDDHVCVGARPRAAVVAGASGRGRAPERVPLIDSGRVRGRRGGSHEHVVSAARRSIDAGKAQDQRNLLGEATIGVIAAALNELPRARVKRDGLPPVEQLVARLREQEIALRIA